MASVKVVAEVWPVSYGPRCLSKVPTLGNKTFIGTEPDRK